MSILSNIIGKIFHTGATANANPNVVSGAANFSPNSTPTSPASQVDVAAELSGMAAKASEQLNWKTSIVDLLKLLGLDSSLTARKQLAKELGYGASTDDTAAMNKWLISQVMQKLAANGGRVPEELLH